jgi:hypothetical protein
VDSRPLLFVFDNVAFRLQFREDLRHVHFTFSLHPFSHPTAPSSAIHSPHSGNSTFSPARYDMDHSVWHGCILKERMSWLGG